MFGIERDLAAALAQFRLDVLQTQRFINASFVFAAMLLSPRRKPRSVRLRP
jgi:hypothetical protein